MFKNKSRKPLLIAALLTPLFGIFVYYAAPGLAQTVQDLQSEINEINEEISEYEDEIENLRERENTLENQLEILDTEIEQARAQIAQTEQEIAGVEAEIVETEEELEATEELIKENARTLYKEGSPSTLEVLFASENFTDFINRQEYLERTKDALNEAAREVVRLQEELEAEKTELDALQVEQQQERSSIESRIAERERLLEETRGEEERYQRLVEEQRQERERLEEEQRQMYAEMAARAQADGQFVDVSGGSYPWDDKPYPCWTSDCVDPWGLYYGECVSYTAWKVASTGRFVPHFGGQGHAYQWPSTAAQHGIESGSTPREGSVAIDSSGPWGHSMYVEEVLDGGSRIHISEYNLHPGQYSERIIPAGGLTYVYF